MSCMIHNVQQLVKVRGEEETMRSLFFLLFPLSLSPSLHISLSFSVEERDTRREGSRHHPALS